MAKISNRREQISQFSIAPSLLECKDEYHASNSNYERFGSAVWQTFHSRRENTSSGHRWKPTVQLKALLSSRRLYYTYFQCF